MAAFTTPATTVAAVNDARAVTENSWALPKLHDPKTAAAPRPTVGLIFPR